MNFRIICIFSLILLIFAPQKRFFPKVSPDLSQKLSPLSKAYFFGDQSDLSVKAKKAHRSLNLQHLMTPSGLHLSALLFILGFFTKRSSLIFLILCALSFFIFPISGFSSFKRMIIFGLIKNNPIVKLDNQHCFWLTFLIAFTLGMYFDGPLSFTLSFLFLGALLSSGFRLQTFLTLFFAQAMISSWLNKSFYPLGSIYGLALSTLSPFIFFAVALENLVSASIISKLWLMLLEFLHNSKGISLANPIFTLLPCYLIGTRKKTRRIALGLSLVLTTMKLNPSFKSKSFPAPPPRAYLTKKNIKGGVKLTYANGLRCYSRLKMDEWSTHCH